MEVDHRERVRERSSSESKIRVIGTHNGAFHCDEVLAVVMLKVLPEYKNAQIIRTRNPELLNTCDIVVDVGSVFDPENLRFDHHQKTFEHSMSSLRPGKPWVTKLSSAGLVYAHYGEEIISIILQKKRDDEVVTKLFDKMYENFIEEIDAIDNGIAVSDGKLKYRVTTTLSRRVGQYNSSWRDPETSEDIDMTNFIKAMELVRTEFVSRIHHYVTEWWEAYSIVAASVENRFDVKKKTYCTTLLSPTRVEFIAHVEETGSVIELAGGGCPWKEHLKDIEDQTGVRIAFVIYPDKLGSMWRVQAVSVTPDSFTSRVPLREDWRGLREKELEQISQIPTIRFVHASGFIGGASDRDAVIKMARMSLAEAKEW